MLRRLITVTSGCLKASSMDTRCHSVSLFLWRTGKRNVVSSIPRMVERNIWLRFLKPMIWANKMLNIVLSVLTINNAKAGGIVSRTFNTVSAVQDFGYCGLWFTEIAYVVWTMIMMWTMIGKRHSTSERWKDVRDPCPVKEPRLVVLSVFQAPSALLPVLQF